MKYTYTTVLVSLFLGTALADECASACSAARDACLGKPGANRSTCAAQFSSCLGFNPYEKQPYVEPTSCNGKGKDKDGYEKGGECLPQCEDRHNKCLTAPGSNKSTCASDREACKGACSGGDEGEKDGHCKKCDGIKNNHDGKQYDGDHDGKHDDGDHDGKHDDGDHDGKHDEKCVPLCEETKTKCIAAPGADHDKCVTECDSCKTLCVDHGQSPVDGHPPVYVAGAAKIQPLAGIFAVAAIAMYI